MTRPKADPKGDLDLFLEHGGFGRVEREYRFDKVRRFRFDWCLIDQPDGPIAIEFDGVLHHGRNQGHASISGILRDSDKGNLAQSMGIRFFRANAKTLTDGTFYDLLAKVLVEVKGKAA